MQNRTHGPTHELLTVASQSVEHDAKGNMTVIPAVLRPGSDPLKLKWDFENKLRAADIDDDGNDDIYYRFDALGRRVARDDGTDHVIFYQFGQQTLADYAAGAAANNPTYTYIFASYIDEPVMRGGSGGLRYYHRNQQYSITALTDGGGTIVERYAYTAYGQGSFHDASGTVQTASASNNRYTYTGREWDEGLSLYHYRARMYDAVAGRFVSRDPIKYRGDFGLYHFLAQTPLSRQDPSGLLAVCCRPMDVTLCGFDIGWLADHCQLRDACVAGETSHPVGTDTDPNRELDDGTSCSTATRGDIEACLQRNKHNNQPYGAPARPGNNCQVGTALRLGKCCLQSSWKPNINCWVPYEVCIRWRRVTIAPYPGPNYCGTSTWVCDEWGYWYSSSPDVPADPPRCPAVDNTSAGGWPDGVDPLRPGL